MSRWCSGKVAIATTSNAQACCSKSAYGWNGLVYLQSTFRELSILTYSTRHIPCNGIFTGDGGRNIPLRNHMLDPACGFFEHECCRCCPSLCEGPEKSAVHFCVEAHSIDHSHPRRTVIFSDTAACK